MKFIYTVIMYLIQPVIWLNLWLKGLRIPAYRKRWTERYGYCLGKVEPNGLLLHSVSVGETLAAVPLVHALRELYPKLPITVTTNTPTGSEITQSFFDKNVYHVYLPYDLPGSINRFLNTLKPLLVIIMETELWPNIISTLYKKKVPLIIANARLSEHSTKRYKKLSPFVRNLLQSITLIAAQSAEEGNRFLSLGLDSSQLVITGNLKFDITVTPELTFQANLLRNKWASNRPVWIASSTHEGEEEIILNVHFNLLKQFPNLLLILVPRHPERFKSVCNLTKKQGLNFILRSNRNIPSSATQVVIGDTIGELMLLYGIADLAFVGGSLIKHGGHNPLEPASHAIPVLMGTHIWNFKDICTKLQQGKGLITITDKCSLQREVTNLLKYEDYRRYYGSCAIKILYQHKGALQHLLCLLEPYLRG